MRSGVYTPGFDRRAESTLQPGGHTSPSSANDSCRNWGCLHLSACSSSLGATAYPLAPNGLVRVGGSRRPAFRRAFPRHHDPRYSSDAYCGQVLEELLHHLIADACVLLARPIPLGTRGNPLELTVEDAATFAAALRASPGHRERSLADCLAQVAWLLRRLHWADDTPPPELVSEGQDAGNVVPLRRAP